MIKRMAPSLLKAALQRQTRAAAARLAKAMPKPTPKPATAKPTLRMATGLTRDVFEQLPNGRSGLGNSVGVARDADISLVRQPGQARPNVTPGSGVTVSDDLENLIELAREATGNGSPIAKGQDKEWGEDTQIHRPDGTEIA